MDNSSILFAGLIIGAIVAVVTKKEDESVGQAIIRGCVTGLVAGVGLDICVSTGGIGGLVIAGATGAIGSVTDTIWEAKNNDEQINAGDIIISGVVGGSLNLLFGVAGREIGCLAKKTIPEVIRSIKNNAIKSITNKSNKIVVKKLVEESVKNLIASSIQGFFGKTFSEIGSRNWEVIFGE